jgi:DNA processing protein
LASFGLPQHIFAASYTSLAAEVGDTLARAITAPLSTDLQRSIEKTQAWLEGGTQRRVLTLADPDYPPSLLSIHDPPTLLYVVGDVAALAREQIAVVGSRSATPAGLKNAQAFAADFARQGLGVSSGLALGIDGAAHTGAIEAGGITLAVMGTGRDTFGFTDYCPRCSRTGAGSFCYTGLDSFTPGQGLPPPDQGRCQAGGVR